MAIWEFYPTYSGRNFLAGSLCSNRLYEIFLFGLYRKNFSGVTRDSVCTDTGLA